MAEGHGRPRDREDHVKQYPEPREVRERLRSLQDELSRLDSAMQKFRVIQEQGGADRVVPAEEQAMADAVMKELLEQARRAGEARAAQFRLAQEASQSTLLPGAKRRGVIRL